MIAPDGREDAELSDNLINNDNWDGATYGVDPDDCCSSVSGSGALYDTSTDTILFSYGTDVLAQTIAINQALELSGIQVDGYSYGWTFRRIMNNRADVDTLIFEVTVKDANGNEVERYTYDRSGPADNTWVTENGYELFGQSYTDPQNIQLKITGKDGGFWAGYYGPEVKDVDLRLIFRANPCATDPLYDTSCPGYADAYAIQQYEQQCQANPLYDIGCNGYEQAYLTQQCSIDALYSPSCVGYSEAYFDQQCSIDPFYDTSCSGYASALYDQQCSADPLYDSGCKGYEQAYFENQCDINPLYDTACTGYASAFYDQQCSVNPLYDTGCVGYETAYYNQQCSLNPLYDTGCNGYADAYFSQQCGLDPLYDVQCPGYQTAYYEQQCTADALYDAGCPGYEQAYFETYVKPEQDRLAAEQANNSTSSTANVVADPTFDTTTSSTGDASVDEVLEVQETVSVTPTGGFSVLAVPSIETSPPQVEIETPVVEEPTEQEQTTEELVVAELEVEAQNETEERTVEPSSDVEEQVDDGGDSEGSGQADEADDSETETSVAGRSESREQARPTPSQKREARRKKIAEIAKQKAMDLAKDMSEAASFEAQQAVQAQVLALIDYNPGFLEYKNMGLSELDFYTQEQMPDGDIDKNTRGLRNGLAQQLLHEKMVDMQYERMNQ